MTNDSAGGRHDREGDWVARLFFSEQDLRLSPEEYVARHAHALGNFSFHHFRYRDPALAGWVRRVAELLCSEGEVSRCQERFLTPEELAAAREDQADGL